MKITNLLLCLSIGFTSVLASGCVQLPTEYQKISDIRPQISFRLLNDASSTAYVHLDGIQIGLVSDYLDGEAAARITPGPHVLRIEQHGRIILEEKFYVADGVSKSFVVR